MNLTFEAVLKLREALKVEFNIDPEAIEIRIPEVVFYAMYHMTLESEFKTYNGPQTSALTKPEASLYQVRLKGI